MSFFKTSGPKNKKGGPENRPSTSNKMLFVALCDADVFGLEALGAFHDIERHGLAFLEALEAGALNRREVHENIVAAGTAQEAESLRVVKPLDCTLFH